MDTLFTKVVSMENKINKNSLSRGSENSTDISEGVFSRLYNLSWLDEYLKPYREEIIKNRQKEA